MYFNILTVYLLCYLGLLQGYDAVMWYLQSTYAGCKTITSNETLWTSS